MFEIKEVLKKLELGVEELILIFLIFVGVMDFLAVIPPSIEFIDTVVAITAISYIFYKVSMTKLIFGQTFKKIDLFVVFSFLLLSMKTISGFLLSVAEEEEFITGGSLLAEFYSLILKNVFIIEKYSFIVGALGLLFCSLFLVSKKITKPCIMGIIHEDSDVLSLPKKMIHFFSIYFILLSIFLLVFSLAVEWLGMSIDAPLLVVVLFFYLFAVVKHGKKFRAGSVLEKISSSSEEFYEKFISLFHSRRTVFTALTGILVLHLLIDVGAFLLPYSTGLMYSSYLKQLGAGHLPLTAIVAEDISISPSLLIQLAVMAVYLLDVLAVLMLFFGPVYAWVYFFRNAHIKLPNMLWLFFGALVVFLIRPVMKIGRFSSSSVLGVDITTNQLVSLDGLGWLLLVSVLVMAVFFLLGLRYHRNITKLAFIITSVFFGIYLFYFFVDLADFYIKGVFILAKNNEFFLSAYMFLFFVITILFYSVSFLAFLHHTHLRKLPEEPTNKTQDLKVITTKVQQQTKKGETK